MEYGPPPYSIKKFLITPSSVGDKNSRVQLSKATLTLFAAKRSTSPEKNISKPKVDAHCLADSTASSTTRVRL